MRGNEEVRRKNQRCEISLYQSLRSYICDDGHTQVGHVSDDLTVLRWDLSMLDQLVQILLCDACSPNTKHNNSEPRDRRFL